MQSLGTNSGLAVFQVSAIQSSPQGISKVVESLQQKFPAASKTLLRSKVREVSDFMDNRWQVSDSFFCMVRVRIPMCMHVSKHLERIMKMEIFGEGIGLICPYYL